MDKDRYIRQLEKAIIETTSYHTSIGEVFNKFMDGTDLNDVSPIFLKVHKKYLRNLKAKRSK